MTPAPMALFGPSIVETGRTPGYPEFQPLHLSVHPERVFHAVSAAAGSRRGWTVVKVDRAARLLHAEARTVWGFVDDIAVWVESPSEGSLVQMRSGARGGADFGRNARRVLAFLRAVESRVRRWS